MAQEGCILAAFCTWSRPFSAWACDFSTRSPIWSTSVCCLSTREARSLKISLTLWTSWLIVVISSSRSRRIASLIASSSMATWSWIRWSPTTTSRSPGASEGPNCALPTRWGRSPLPEVTCDTDDDDDAPFVLLALDDDAAAFDFLRAARLEALIFSMTFRRSTPTRSKSFRSLESAALGLACSFLGKSSIRRGNSANDLRSVAARSSTTSCWAATCRRDSSSGSGSWARAVARRSNNTMFCWNWCSVSPIVVKLDGTSAGSASREPCPAAAANDDRRPTSENDISGWIDDRRTQEESGVTRKVTRVVTW
mmetsp:Transcript_36392/g.116644  ORF Transcript_36392/g.116644 Transcript_36392/m.116644 type:complete len:310 (-) Transcript_36392:38-967(-)